MKVNGKKKITRLLIMIILCSSLISSNLTLVYANVIGKKDIKALYPGYDLWIPSYTEAGEPEYNGALYCPKENCTIEEMLSYSYDIFRILKSEYITDYTEPNISFNFNKGPFSSVKSFDVYNYQLYWLRASLFSDTGALYTSYPDWSAPEEDENESQITFDFEINGPKKSYGEAKTRQYLKELKNIVKDIKAASKNEKELAEKLGLWINNNIKYCHDLDVEFDPFSSFDTYFHRTGTCQGYSHLYRELCDIAGLPCLLISSTGPDHMWNWVNADGKWYCIDTTSSDLFYKLGDEPEDLPENFTDPDCLDQYDYYSFLKSLVTDPAPLITTCEQTLNINKTANLKNYLHNLKSGSKVTFTSSAPSVISVDSSGKVTAKKYGSAVISIQVSQSGKTWKFKQPISYEKPDPGEVDITDDDEKKEINGSKKEQNMTVTAKAKTVKKKKVKKKKQKVKGAIKVTGAVGKVTYKKIKKGSSKKLSINSKTGVITVKKGTKKGKYKIKVQITAAGNADYKAKTISKTVKIKVK